MKLAYPLQKIQDWITQQWVILFGQKIESKTHHWLIGPFGELNGIGGNFIHQLAEKENLIIDREQQNKGLINNFNALHLKPDELERIHPMIIDFYENTSNYTLHLTVKWNPIFIPFGFLLQKIFSQRLNQLNIPTQNLNQDDSIESEIIQLKSPSTHEILYTFWLRKSAQTGTVIYAGIYGTTELPNEKHVVKAVFPLPKGNATVLLEPIVSKDGQFILRSVGQTFGDVGFYFLLHDARQQKWAKYIATFQDQLTVSVKNETLIAKQQLRIWQRNVVEFNYKIHPKA